MVGTGGATVDSYLVVSYPRHLAVGPRRQRQVCIRPRSINSRPIACARAPGKSAIPMNLTGELGVGRAPVGHLLIRIWCLALPISGLLSQTVG